MDVTTLLARLRDRQDGAIFLFGKGPTVRRTYAELYADVMTACAKLAAWGLKPGMRVGIRAPNCYEWIVYDLALIENRAVSVAFTDDFAAADPRELAEKYALSLMLVSTGEKARHPETEGFVAYLDGENSNVKPIDRGAGEPDPQFERPWLIFSSGSSGGLKGMVLNRKGVEANVAAFTHAIDVRGDDRWLIFLPISNFQQRMMYYAALWHGFDIIVTDPARLFLALRDLSATILVAPPSFYEAIETRFSNLPGWKKRAKRFAADLALRIPSGRMRRQLARRLFKDAHGMFGARMRIMVTGMAPIKRTTLDLFRRMQLPLFETYGLAECCSIAINVPGASRIGSVGRVLPGLTVAFADDGEIVVRRDHAAVLRYFQSTEGENERTFIGDNRVATGDIGRFDKDGYLYIVGRKKEIIVTAGGEKIHPEALEAEIDACADVTKAVVFASDRTRFLIAIVLPHADCDPLAKSRIEQFIEQINERRPSMRIGRILFTDTAFSRENGFLRPNLKLDRKRIAQHFQAKISAFDA